MAAFFALSMKLSSTFFPEVAEFNTLNVLVTDRGGFSCQIYEFSDNAEKSPTIRKEKPEPLLRRLRRTVLPLNSSRRLAPKTAHLLPKQERGRERFVLSVQLNGRLPG